MPYQKLKVFLEAELKKDDSIISGYSFSGMPVHEFMKEIGGDYYRNQYLESPTSYPSYRARLFPIEENYLENIQPKYYNPTRF